MRKTKKRTRRLMALGLCLMMLISTGLMASASEHHTFHFKLQAGGENKRTSSYTKETYDPYACMEFTKADNPSSLDVMYRLRASADNAEASILYYLRGTGTHHPNYNGGHGQYGKLYYFRIQTNSSSKHSAEVIGSWRP